MDTNATLSSRLRLLLDTENLSFSEFERRCGLYQGFVRKTTDRSSDNCLALILPKFPNWNADWLLSGQGEMFNGLGRTVSSQERETYMRLLAQRDERIAELEREVLRLSVEIDKNPQ